MQSVTSAWLHERGLLHYARVRDVRTSTSSLQIDLDDEWASLRGLGKPEGQEAPGTLVVEGYASIEGETTSIDGGWISEVTADSDELSIVFCDKPSLRFRANAVWWRSAE